MRFQGLVLPILLLLTTASVSQANAELPRYGIVERPDGIRHMFVSPEPLNGWTSGALPEGTVIVMESRRGDSATVFAKRKTAQGWDYASGTPGSALAFGPNAACHSCHRDARTRDFTFTLPLLERWRQDGAIRSVACNRTGRAPCAERLYQVD